MVELELVQLMTRSEQMLVVDEEHVDVVELFSLARGLTRQLVVQQVEVVQRVELKDELTELTPRHHRLHPRLPGLSVSVELMSGGDILPR